MSSLPNFLNQKLTSLKNEAAAVVSNPTIVAATKRLLGSAALRAGRALGHLILKRTAEAKQEALSLLRRCKRIAKALYLHALRWYAGRVGVDMKNAEAHAMRALGAVAIELVALVIPLFARVRV